MSTRIPRILLLVFFLFSFSAFTQTRYWVAGGAAAWSSDNWAASSGGVADGGGPPTALQSARFDANGLGNCTVDAVDPTIAGLLLNGYTGTIDLNGNTVTATGTVTLTSGTINDTPGTDSLVVNATGTTTFNGTTFGAIVHTTSRSVALSGSTFNARSTFIKNGTGNITGTGGNIYNGDVYLTHSGANNFILANTNPDDFNGSLIITNSGTGTIYLSYTATGNTYDGNIIINSTGTNSNVLFGNNNGTSTLGSGLTVSIGGSGFSSGTLRLRNFTQAGATAQALTLSGTTTILDIYDSNWGGGVTFSSPRITTRGTTYQGAASMTKTGASNDRSVGGNRFNGNVTLTHLGSNEFLFGNTSPDTFDLDLGIINSGTGSFYLADNALNNLVSGNLTATNDATGAGNYIYLSDNVGSSLTINGDVTITNSATASDARIYLGNIGDVTIGGNVIGTNSASGAAGYIFVGNSDGSVVSITGTTTITNSGAGTIKRVFLGNYGDVSFGGALSITNSSTATNSQVYLNDRPASINAYNGNISFESTDANNDGLYFGSNGGAGTLAATRTISIGGGGFLAPNLYLRNLTQTGATSQALAPTGTISNMTIYDCSWGGDVVFSSPRITTRGTTYSGTASLTKTGATDDASVGGNTFTGNATLTNSGSGYFLMGNGSADTFGGDLDLINSGTRHLYVGHNSAGNTVAGNLTATNSGTGTSHIYLSNTVASSLAITGTTTLTNSSSGTASYIYLGNTGDVTLNSSLNIVNASTGTTGNTYVGAADGSVVTIAGNTTVTNSGGSTTKRVYLGDQGDVTFNGTLAITNNSTATNSQVYCNNGTNSTNVYDQNITIESTSSSNDGVLFGNSSGTGTLAATRTISIGGGGYIGTGLTFRNFTQTGATAQTLAPTGTATNFIIYDCSWGGDVVFSSPRISTRGTTYSGTVSLTKTGASDDRSVGGNTFTGNTTLTLTGSREFSMGNGSPDTFSGDLTVNNNGTYHMHIGYNSAGNTIAGNLTANHTGTGTGHIYFSNNIASTLTITGTTSLTNNASGTTNYIYLGGSGDVTLNSSLSITNSSTGTTGNIYVANADGSVVTVAGNTTVSNSGGNTTKRVYLGEQGDVTFNGTLSIINSSSANNSQVYCNNNANSVNVYSENITIESTDANSDGVLFGNSNGSGTLAATKTISIGGGGFIGSFLTLRNFTQVGATAQTLHPSGPTTYMTLYDCNWGGNVDFSAAQMLTRGTTYSGTASLEKTGATDNNSIGGNTFVGDAILTNSGSAQFMMGNGSPDTFAGDLDINNSGTDHFFLARESIGNTVAGNFTVTNSGTGTSNVYLAERSASDLEITGVATIINSATGISSIIYVGDEGDITFGNDLTLTNSSSAATGQIILADGANSSASVTGNIIATNSGAGGVKRIYLGNAGPATIGGDVSLSNSNTATTGEVYIGNGVASIVSITGNTILTNDGAGTTRRAYLGNNGDISFGGTLSITNNSTATNSEVYCNHTANSVNAYAGDITLVSTSSDCDGVYFGNSGTGGSGTLAATRTISIGGGGFLADFLYLRNFTQIGATAQTLQPAGPTTYMTIYDCNWGGDIIFSSAQILTRGTTYSGTASLTKTGAADNQSQGGNTFTGNATLTNSGSGYFLMGNGSPDTFGGDLDMINTASDHMYLAYNSAGNTIAGNFTATNAGTGTSDIYLSDLNTSTLSITGTTVITNSASGVTNNVYIGDEGDVTLGSTLDITNSASGTTGQVFLADDASSVAIVSGIATISNNGSGGTKNVYLGNAGDVTFGSDLAITSSTDGVSGQVFVADDASSMVTVAGNAISTNSGANGTKNIYLGNSGDVTFSGDLSITNSTNSASGQTFLADDALSVVSVSGNTIATNSGAGTIKRIYLGNDGSVSFGGDLTLSNSNTATTGEFYVGDGSASIITIVGNTTLTNDGSGTTRRTWLGNAGDVSFGGSLSITNNSDATNSEVYLQDDASSVNAYAGDIILVSTSPDCDGVYFGNSTGSGTLAATRTISIGGGGFLADFLTIRNFTQVGATAQTLHPAGPTTYMTLYDCNWGGDIDFSAAQMLTRGTTYLGTTSLEKTGATDNSSAGGNTFVGNTVLTNSGSGYFLMGNNGNPDTFGGDLDLLCTASDHLYLAYNSAGNTVAGNFTATNSGTGTSHIHLSDQPASTLTVTGTAIITNASSGTTNHIYIGNAGDVTFGSSLTVINSSTSSTANIFLADDGSSSVSVAGNTIATNSGAGGTNRIYLGNAGSATFSGDLTLSNSNTSTVGEIYVANNAVSSVSIIGNTTLTNDGAGTTKRTYLGSSGDVSFGGTLTITNNSTATNSQVYCNNSASSVNAYAGNIILESTSASTDGILFGNSNGSGTLAATRTISIGGGGFIAGNLTLRNFTQVGATAQALHPTGTTIMLIDDSNWGGDVDFSSPRLDVEGSTFSGTASLDKTGSGNDRSAGGNTFVGNATIINSGSGYWRFGEGTTDDFNANLDLINSGTNHLYLAYSGAGHIVSGDLTATNSSTGVGYLYLSHSSGSTLTVNGTTTIVNSGNGSDTRFYVGNSGDIAFNDEVSVTNSASGNLGYLYFANGSNSAISVGGTSTFINSGNSPDCRMYVGASGDATFNDDVTITNSASGNQGLMYMGNGTSSEVIVNGNTTVTNSGALTTKRSFLGNQGDVTYNGTLSITNSSTATNSQVYCNYEDNSTNAYNGNITMESTSASNDGILFGNSGGAGTLGAGSTISIGAGGFIGSTLYFRDFTQTGATAQTLAPTGITTFTLYESNWGGDVTFSSARLTSRSCTYSSIASLEKNGASNDDWYGGNTFNGAATITHSGTGRWRISSSVGDIYADDVSYIKTGSGTFEPARNGTTTYAGNINFDLNSLVTFATNNGIMEMNGTTAQSINDLGVSTEPRFRRVVLNNPNDEITLNTPIEISTSITFTQGNIITTDANLLTIRDEALALTASDDSYVRGPIEKVGEDDFIFPVGDSGLYRPIAISGGSGKNNSTAFRATYYEVNPDSAGWTRNSLEGTIDHVSANEYWILDRTNGTATSEVTLSWDSNSGVIDDVNDLYVARWGSGQWNNQWSGGTTGDVNVGTVISSTAISTFSPFTLSSGFDSSPLPIELISFDAEVFNQQVQLKWKTATEINNDYFTIERSTDGKNFEFVTTVQGAGNSNVINTYGSYDSDPLPGTSYYRLTQTDFDGTTIEEGVVSVSFTKRKSIPFKIYPNPVTNHNINLEWNSIEVTDCLIVLYNLKGEKLQESIIPANEGFNQSTFSLNLSISAGNYILAVFEKGKLKESIPLIVK